jgi:hypothetical protein
MQVQMLSVNTTWARTYSNSLQLTISQCRVVACTGTRCSEPQRCR